VASTVVSRMPLPVLYYLTQRGRAAKAVADRELATAAH